MNARRLLVPALLFLSFTSSVAAGINVWTPVGPWGGSIRAVVVHPTDPRIVYAATANGVFVTIDGGASWRSTSPNFDGLGRSTSDVLVAPSSPSTIYVSNGRLYRSTDGGATWQRRSPEGFFASNGLAVDPHDPAVLWAGSFGTDRGILKSVDGGATFHSVFAVQSWIECVAFAPWDAGTLFAGLAGTTGEPPGILRSTDGGVTWQRAESGLELPGNGGLQIRIAFAPDAPGTLYAAIASFNDFQVAPAIFRSRDGGDTWERRGPGGFPVAAGRNGAVYSGSGARSLDFGETWSTVSRPNGQVLALVVDPQAPGTVWAGTSYRGLFKTTDSGTSWRTAHQGIAATQSESLAIDPVHPNVLYAGLTGGGLLKTVRGGTVWRELDPGLPDPDLFSSYGALAVDPLDTERVYAVGDEGTKVLASRDGGITWEDQGNPGGVLDRTLDLAPDPGATGVLYAAGYGSLGCKSFKTLDGGDTWRCLRVGQASHIVVDPREPAYVYAVTDVVSRSIDRGSTWRAARRGVPDSAQTSSIAISPSSPNVLYLGAWRGIYKSTDRAQSWHAVGVGLPAGYNRIMALAVDPRSPAIAWAAVEHNGVYRTVDGGAHWRPLNSGLPLQVTGQLILDPRDPAAAYAGSFGGVYKITVR